eukprot:2266261-Amphidinium_carterae.2
MSKFASQTQHLCFHTACAEFHHRTGHLLSEPGRCFAGAALFFASLWSRSSNSSSTSLQSVGRASTPHVTGNAKRGNLCRLEIEQKISKVARSFFVCEDCTASCVATLNPCGQPLLQLSVSCAWLWAFWRIATQLTCSSHEGTAPTPASGVAQKTRSKTSRMTSRYSYHPAWTIQRFPVCRPVCNGIILVSCGEEQIAPICLKANKRQCLNAVCVLFSKFQE